MKVNIFYSWQSDLPNNKNRGLINECINEASKYLLRNVKAITEINIESDSRNEVGTPDLVATIFSKIDICDIFIADISIINTGDNCRKTPNPNVMIELGYASKSIGWQRILCIFNTEFAKIEELPFDIRFRKPICYNTSEEKAVAKKQITKWIQVSIMDIIEQQILDKKEYLHTKRQVDLGMQAILIDFCNMLYSNSGSPDQCNYFKLLNSIEEDVLNSIENRTILGFEFYKNISLNINEFIDFFNNRIETYFLSDLEVKLIVKMVYALRTYKDLIHNKSTLKLEGKDISHKLMRGTDINKDNERNTFVLLKIIDEKNAVIVRSGRFEDDDINKLLNIYSINEEGKTNFAKCIHNIIQITNDWIKLTGNHFIYNLK